MTALSPSSNLVCSLLSLLVEEMEEEVDEETRRFNFWTHQINIFLLRKLFPAHQHLMDVQAKKSSVREEQQVRS